MIGLPAVGVPMGFETKQTLRPTWKYARRTYVDDDHCHHACRTINQVVRTLSKLVGRKPRIGTSLEFSVAIFDMAQHLPRWHLWLEDRPSIEQAAACSIMPLALAITIPGVIAGVESSVPRKGNRMFRKFFSIGLIAAACVASFCDTSEAGHRHRRARNSGARNYCEPVQQSACDNINSGYSTYSDSGYGYPSSQQYGSSNYESGNYGYNGYPTQSYGTSSYQGGQVGVNARVGGNMVGNPTILGR